MAYWLLQQRSATLVLWSIFAPSWYGCKGVEPGIVHDRYGVCVYGVCDIHAVSILTSSRQ